MAGLHARACSDMGRGSSARKGRGPGGWEGRRRRVQAPRPGGGPPASGRSHASKRPLAHAPALQHARWGQDAPDMSLRLQASAADMRTWGARL